MEGGSLVLLNHGGGQLDAVPATQSSEDILAVPDVNGDHKPDLVRCDGLPLGRGDGTFEVVIPLAPQLVRSGRVLKGDFNGDRRVDLVVTTQVAINNCN